MGKAPRVRDVWLVVSSSALVALSLSLRLAQSKVASDPVAAEQVLEAARDELLAALDELRKLA